MLACDWILESRTELWELEYSGINDDEYCHVSGEMLENFQIDLNLLRNIVEDIPVILLTIINYKIRKFSMHNRFVLISLNFV